MGTLTASADSRAALYRRLQKRNLLIGVLRFAVPILGMVVLVALMAQLIIANIANQFLPEGARIEDQTVVLDAPSYSGRMANGTRYTITADLAQAAVDDPDLIHLSTAHMDLLRPSGQQIVLQSAQAQFSFSSQVVEVPGEMYVLSDDGMEARLFDTIFDWGAQISTTRGDVHVTFADGSVLTADALRYDGGAETWEFTDVTLKTNRQSEAE